MKYTNLKRFFTRKQIIALIISLIILIESFSPYGILLSEVHAASPIKENKPYFEIDIHPIDTSKDYDHWDNDTTYYYYDFDPDTDTIETYSGTRIVTMDIIIKNGTTVTGLNAGNIKLKYDKSILSPIVEVNIGTNKRPIWELQEPTDMEDWASDGIYFDTSPATGIDTSSCTFRIDGATTKTMADETVIATLTFKLADGKTMEDITTDVFSIGDPDDIMLAYDGGAYYVNGKDYLLFKGFSAGAKKINNISFKSQPTKNKYYNTETLDFTGAILTVSYDDGSSEDVTVSDAITSGKITLDSTTANNTTKKTTLTYDGETIDFDYYVLDSISKKTNLTKMNYEHGDTIDFSGGQLTATYKDSSGNTLEDTLNIASEIATGEITVDKTKADVDNKKVTFTYKSLTTDMTLTVTDPVSSISITKQPTNVTYDDGDTISLAGGEITPVTKSGKTLTPISADDSKVTASSTTASISSIPVSDRWVIAGGNGLTAGNQKITLTYEGKTADLNIVVNDTVSGVSITTQPTAQNKYGTSAGALNYSGLVATITTSGGGSFTVGASSLAIDASGYNPTKLAKQSLPVKYGTINSTNTVDIQLVNYITGITTAFTKTEFDYDTSLDDVISNGKYVEVYADGSSSSPKTITAGMVTGYVQKPAGSLFNVNHKYNETLTIKLDSSSNVFDKLPATATQVITINDVIKDISVLYKPSKVTYKYGEAFSATGGQININYISGAQSNISMEASGVTLTEQDGSTINMSPSASSFVSKTATKTIKVSYTSNGKIFDTSFDVYIKDEAASISISKNPKTIFNHGDTFDESAGELKIVYKSGNSEVINLNQAVVTESDGSEVDMEPKYSKYTNNNLVKNLLVTYRGKTTNYDITLQNPIDSITIENTPKQSYKLNEATTGVGGTIKVTRKAGNTESINIDDSMVSGLDTTVAGTGKTATITYTDEFGNLKTTTYTYDVIDNVTSIDIVAPSKNVYNHGEALALDGTITVHYASGTTNNVTMTSSMIKEGSGAVDMSPTSYDDDTQKVNKKLTIEYSEGGVTKSIDYPITIINDVKSIAVQDPATKTTYNIGDTLDVTGLSISVTRATGTPKVVTVTPDMITGFDSSKENTNLSLTISYTENGITKTTTYEVSVVDSVKSITINGTPQSEVKYGEELDLSKIKLDVTKGSGTIQETVTDSMISGYDKTKLGKQTVTITYGGQTTTFDVTVKDYVTKIEVNPSSVTGTYNDELSKLITDNSIKYTVTYAKAGAQSPIALAESMVNGYNKATTTAQNLTVTYTDNDSNSYTNGDNFTASLQVTLMNTVSGITITPPTKTTYNHGDSLDLAGGEINLTYEDGTSGTLDISKATITESDGSPLNMSPASYDGTQKVDKTLKIEYSKDGQTGTVNYPITIINDIKSIAVHDPATKTTYNIRDTLDVTGLSILVTRAMGTTGVVTVTPDMVTGFDSSKENTNLSLTISYTENGITKTATYEVSVVDSVKSITINGTPQSEVKYGEELDLSKIKLDVTKGSGTTQETVTDSMISGYDKTKLGKQTVTITYGGQTTTFDVTVKDYVTKIEVNPSSVTGKYNDELSKLITDNSIKYTVTYAKAGAQSPIALAESMVSGYNKATTTAQNLTITYTDNDSSSYTNGNNFTTSLQVTLMNTVSGITITPPTKTTYNHGDSLDLTGGEINLTYEDGTSGTLDINKATITESDGSPLNMSPASYGKEQKVDKTLKIEYSKDGQTGTVNYPITIINDIKSIAVHDPATKTTYNIGDTLDVTGLSILVTRAMGTTEVITVTPDMVTGFDSSKENTNLVLTISYTENGITKTANYTVSVTDTVKSISLNGINPSTVKYGEELDLSGVTIAVTKGSGTTTENVTSSMISGYDKTKLGKQTVTITYGGQTTSFDITVKDYVTKIEVSPDSVTGTYNDELSKVIADNNIKYTVTYAKAGAQSPIALAESMVSGYNKTTTTAQNLTITYTDNDSNSYTNGDNFTASLQVTLMNTVSGITITPPTKTTYNHGDSLDLAGGEINLTYEDGTSGTLDINKATITESDGSPLNMSPASYDGTQKVDKTLKIEYSKDGQTGTVNYPITIINDVKSITIKTLPQTEYKVNETLDITTGELLVTRAVGTEIVTMSSPKVTVSGFDNTQESKDLKLTVDYTENGITKTTDYLVNVTDNVQSISLKTMPPTNYKYGEPLNVTGGQIEVVKDSGVQTINITNDMIKELDGSEFDSTKLGTRKLQISYGGKTLEYEITVEDYVTGIILTPPTKLVYECGEELDLTGGKIEKVMASGTKIDVALSDSSVSISGYDKTKAGSQTINVTYEGITKQFGVTVEDNVQSVTLIGTPKTEYKYGESLDVAGLQLEVTSSSGNKQYVTVTPSMVTGFNSNQLGEQILIITYKGKTVQYKVNVKDYVKDIEIVEPTKLVYKLNETIDLSGGTVRAVMASGTATSPVAMTSAMITGFDSTSIGAKTLTVSYQGYTKTFGITVQDLTNSMVIKTLPNKVKYLYGQKLDLTGGTIEITKESGETEIISITSSMVTGYNSNKLGTQTLTVTYDGLSQTFPVTVEDYELNSLFITPPTKRNYEYGESLDLTGGKVTTKMASGAIKESTNMTASMISGFDNTKVGSQKITVTYDGKSNSFTISVKDSIKGISMNTQPNKTNYDFGANLDVSGATITVVKSSGITVIPVTSDMISEYNPKNAGTHVIKVSYGGFTTNFIVNVLPKKNSTKDSNTKDNTNINRHHNKTNNNNNEEANIPNQEETKDNQITNDNVQENQNTKPKENTKEEDNKEVPKNNTKDDKKQEDKDIEGNKGINKKSIAAIIAAIALGILILIIVFKRNVRILIEEDGEFVLGGLDKVSKNNLKLDIDQYLDKDTYDNKVKVVFNDSISKKLDGKIIEINYKNRVFKYKIHYADKPFEINLDNSVINRIEVIK
ncbi:MAG TPA: bacterial Ig-like domain-containing protein [Clostridiaceae bacterium]|nr:bacterial Ig-like domain-containing protein [Clostridiaceae bacterium]